jgi:hypothetical protein
MATMPDGKFTKIKKVLVGVSGAVMLFASINLSKEGVGFTGEAVWIGVAIAVSLSCAEFMFNSNFEEMNWTILVIGIGAYIYSIMTNIAGFYSFQGIEGTIWTNFNLKALLGGIFMDVYPELAIAWALKESKVGDLLGNIVKTWVDPQKMTEPQKYNSSQNQNSGGKSQTTIRMPVTDRMSRRQQAEMKRPISSSGNKPNQSQGREPTYHPMGMGQSTQKMNIPNMLEGDEE